MAYFAKIDENSKVIEVIHVNNEVITLNGEELESLGQEFLKKLYNDNEGVYKKTSYNTIGKKHYTNGILSQDQSKSFRGNYAGVGYTYDSLNDIFIPPQPYPSWSLNLENAQWEAPIPCPKDGNNYKWSEIDQIWILSSY